MNLKNKLLMFTGTGIFGVSLVVGGATFALFTSNAQNTSEGKAGTIVLTQERDQGDSIPGPMFYSAESDPTGLFPYDTTKNVPDAPPGAEALGGWAPGDKATRAMNLYNKGSLDARVKKLKATINPLGITSGVAYDQFIQKMNIKVMYPAQSKTLYDGPLAGLLNGYVTIPSFIIAKNPSAAANITFEASLDLSADNSIQGKSFVFDFTFYAEQKRNNN